MSKWYSKCIIERENHHRRTQQRINLGKKWGVKEEKRKEKKHKQLTWYWKGGRLNNEPGFRRILEEFPFGIKHNQCHLSITEHRDFISFLAQPGSPFGEGDLATDFVLDLLQLNPSSSHLQTFPIKKDQVRKGREK